MLAMTAGEGAGVWMAGQGPAADPQGYLYLLTGNGDFDGTSQWGESFLKLKYTPPAEELQPAYRWSTTGPHGPTWPEPGRSRRQPTSWLA